MPATRLVITGRVQGVWFRAWTAREATSLGLRGWVRNLSDGSVETLLIGDADAIENMVARCHIGPPAAKITTIDRHHALDDGGGDFRQR